ncbi:helix-turn-helix domain-containing protein [Streptomyces sp. NPDC055085]
MEQVCSVQALNSCFCCLGRHENGATCLQNENQNCTSGGRLRGMALGLDERLRSAVAALLHATGESQAGLAAALGVSQAQVSRRQSGASAWSVADCDLVAAHFGIGVLELLAGPTHATESLPAQRRRAVGRSASRARRAAAQGGGNL